MFDIRRSAQPRGTTSLTLIDDQRMIPYVYDHLIHLPAEQFNNTMQTLLGGRRPARKARAAATGSADQ
jgi:hypothetical protein